VVVITAITGAPDGGNRLLGPYGSGQPEHDNLGMKHRNVDPGRTSPSGRHVVYLLRSRPLLPHGPCSPRRKYSRVCVGSSFGQ